jgi:class 3 adenylate cyclase
MRNSVAPDIDTSDTLSTSTSTTPIHNKLHDRVFDVEESKTITSTIKPFEEELVNRKKKKNVVKDAFLYMCPAIITVRNVLLFIFVLQTIIIIVGALAVTMTAGKQSENQVQNLKQENMISQIKNSISTAPVAINMFKHLFEKVDFDTNDVQSWSKALLTVKNVYSDIGSFIYFGVPNGGLRGVLLGFFIYANGGDSLLGIYECNSRYEVIALEGSSTFGVNMTRSSWYQEALTIDTSTQMGVWTENPSSPDPFSVIASTPITRQGTFLGVAAIHFELANFAKILENASNSTKGSVAFILNKYGDMVAISNKSPTYLLDIDGVTRLRLKGRDNKDLVIRNVVRHMELKLGDLSVDEKLEAVIKIDGKKYSYIAYRVGDTMELDWMVVSVLEKRNFLYRVIVNNYSLLIVIVIASIITISVVIAVIHAITIPLNQVSRNMIAISKMDVAPPKQPTGFVQNPFYEIKIMRSSVNMMKASLLSFQKYIPVDVVKKIVQSGRQAELGMERKSMSIFFCDIADFTTISEETQPELLTFMVGEYFSIVTNTSKNNYGITDKYIGDAVMLLFLDDTHDEDGNELPHHAIRAVQTALECQKQFTKKRIEYRGKVGLRELFVRIGVNSGDALVGNIGSEVRIQYTAIGDAVNTASRFEALNKPFGSDIMIGEETQKSVQGIILTHWMDSVKVKGKNLAVKIYEPIRTISKAHTLELKMSAELEELKSILIDKKDPKLILDKCDEIERMNDSIPDLRRTAVEYTIQRMRERAQNIIHQGTVDPEIVHLKLYEK